MPAINIPFNGAAIINACNQFNIDPDAVTHHIRGWAQHDRYLYLRDSAAGGHPEVRKFVWFSPDLPTRIIAGAITTLKQNKVPCGFDVDHALCYEEVYAVGQFAQSDLDALASAGITVKNNVPHNSPAALRKHLKSVL